MADILWIQNGRVIDPANQRDAVGEVFAVDGKIVGSLSDAQKAEATVVDAKGLVVAPGL
ncbi:MAG TPA: dihydroorotase, partial [Opitutae bacterium]|nr:dihydroorotase [Opitutae bacterium]